MASNKGIKKPVKKAPAKKVVVKAPAKAVKKAPAKKVVVKAPAKAIKKATIKAGVPAAKTIEKNSKKEVEEVVAPAKWKKVQTAEGWKRSMKKAMAKK